MHEAPELLRTRDVADMLGMTPDRVRRMARQNEIPHVRMTPRSIRYPRLAVEAWVEQLREQSIENLRRDRA